MSLLLAADRQPIYFIEQSGVPTYSKKKQAENVEIFHLVEYMGCFAANIKAVISIVYFDFTV